jgi:DUF971 family protein
LRESQGDQTGESDCKLRAALFTSRTKQLQNSSVLRPKTIQKIGTELAISWSDGEESYIPLETLRRACPCAACGGEPDVLGRIARPRVHYSPDSFDLKGFEIVGGYGVQPRWADGHHSGIYSFTYLQRLASGT